MNAIILQKHRQSQVVSVGKWRKSVILLVFDFSEEIDGFSKLFSLYFAVIFIAFRTFMV